LKKEEEELKRKQAFAGAGAKITEMKRWRGIKQGAERRIR